MWKSIGSINSKEDKSLRSNRSREQLPNEPFRPGKAHKSSFSPDPNRSFCFDYLERKKEDQRNITYNSRVHSQHKSDASRKEDMFTSMRNVLSKADPTSKLDSQNHKNPEEEKIKYEAAAKQALNRVKALKREHSKLSTNIQEGFASFKNYFYQLEDFLHTGPPSQPVTAPNQSQSELAREILQDALGIDRFFQEMDRKKGAIMERLSLKE